MIQLRITHTAKNYGAKDGYTAFDHSTEVFADMAEAKAWLRETYGNSKRQYIYRDTKSGKTRRVGYIYGFRNSDWSHSPVEKWQQQDWISFYKVTELTV